MTSTTSIKNQKLEFDDIVKDNYGTWTQTCEQHSKMLEPKKLEEVPIEGLICGVKNCDKKALYYYTIKEIELE